MRNEEIYQRRLQGWTYEQLGEFYGIKKPTVFVIIKRMEERLKKEDVSNI